MRCHELIAAHRAILAAEIFQRRGAAIDDDAGMSPRDTDQIDPYGRIRVAAEDVDAVSERESRTDLSDTRSNKAVTDTEVRRSIVD